MIRAHQVEQLASRLATAKVDPEIAYLTTDAPVVTRFARQYRLDDWMPFNLKKLRAHLRARNVGRVVVKKRGSPLKPDEMIERLKLRGDEERVLCLTKVYGRPAVLVGLPAGW